MSERLSHKRRTGRGVLIVLVTVVVVAVVAVALWRYVLPGSVLPSSTDWTPSQPSGTGVIIKPSNSPSASGGPSANICIDAFDTGEYLPISNYSSVVRNVPDSERIKLEWLLCSLASANWMDGVPADTQAVTRERSYKQTYTKKTQMYTTTFIVDLPSLSASFRMRDRWSTLPDDQVGLDGETNAQIRCPDPEDLIYGPFDCVDWGYEDWQNW